MCSASCTSAAPAASRAITRNARQRIRGVRFGDCEYAAALQVVHQGSGRAQREGSQGSGERGNARCGSISCASLVAEEQRPAALECEPVAVCWLRLRLRCAALGEPPVSRAR